MFFDENFKKAVLKDYEDCEFNFILNKEILIECPHSIESIEVKDDEIIYSKDEGA